MTSPRSKPTAKDDKPAKGRQSGTGRLKAKIGKARAAGEKLLTKAYYKIPLFSDKNPRKHIVPFGKHCQRVPALPPAAEMSRRDWYLPISPPTTFKRQSTIAVDKADALRFEAGIMQHQRGIDMHRPEIFIAGVHGAELHGKTGAVLSADRKILFESGYNSEAILEESGIFNLLPRQRPIGKSGGHCLLLSPWSSFAYYHWLMEALPRLSLIERFSAFDHLPLIVPGDLRSYHRETLELAGVPEERLAKFSGATPWRMEFLVFPEVFGWNGSPTIEVVTWLREKFLPAAGPADSRRRRIYVSRRDAKRNVVNEAEIEALLAARGFEVICPADYSFREQVRIFSQAEVVVGPHGAGFSNMAFAPQGATLIEFFGDNYVNGCFWALANTCGHRHAVIMAPTATLDYRIPTEKLTATLDLLKI